jgi:hypothetical protein
LTTLQAQVVTVRQQRVLLSFDEAAIFALQPGVLAFARLIERLLQVTQHVELVEQDRRLRCRAGPGVSQRLPHIHDRQTNATGLLLTQPAVELSHTGLRTVLATKPDRACADQVADHDAIGMAFANRHFVDANDLGTRRTGALELPAHLLLVQLFDRVPVQLELLGHILAARLAAAPPHKVGEALGVERVVGQESSRPRFTLPQLPQCTRRTSNSKYTRVSPQDRSRTRRVLRSYQPACPRPQRPHRVFLSPG